MTLIFMILMTFFFFNYRWSWWILAALTSVAQTQFTVTVPRKWTDLEWSETRPETVVSVTALDRRMTWWLWSLARRAWWIRERGKRVG